MNINSTKPLKVSVIIVDSCGSETNYSREANADYVNTIYDGSEIKFIVDQFRYALLAQGYDPNTVEEFIPEVLY